VITRGAAALTFEAVIGRWIRSVVDFARAWATRFLDVQGIDRAMAVAAQAFSALIPLLIVYNAVAPAKNTKDFASTLIDRFNLTGETAASVQAAFGSPQGVESAISGLGIFLLLVSALSFTRGMQRLYEGAYRLEALGVRNTVKGLQWLAMIVVYFSVRPAAANVVDRPVLRAVISLTLAAAAWTATPYLLLGKRVGTRRLLPGAVLTSFGMSALTVTSVIWFPRSITSSAEQFGAMGVAFALLSWLFAAGVVLVVAATGGAVIAEHYDRYRRR